MEIICCHLQRNGMNCHIICRNVDDDVAAEKTLTGAWSGANLQSSILTLPLRLRTSHTSYNLAKTGPRDPAMIHKAVISSKTVCVSSIRHSAATPALRPSVGKRSRRVVHQGLIARGCPGLYIFLTRIRIRQDRKPMCRFEGLGKLA